MKQINCLLALVTALSVSSFTAPAWGQYGGDGYFNGGFMLGYRIVDVDGSEQKFKEDINLDDGARLFNLNFDFAPSQEHRNLVDLVNFDMNNFGGDPFESLSLSVRKYGRYNFNYNRRKSDYFLPGESVGDHTIYFSKFDFERVHDTATFDMRLSTAARFYFGFDRFTKEGDSTVNMDIERDEFQFLSPIDESLNEYRAGFEYAWEKVTLVLEERIHDYENAMEIFLPGFSGGENQEDEASLDFFFSNQPYDFTDLQHTARVLASPNERLTIETEASLHNLEMEMNSNEQSQGIGYDGTSFSTDVSENGDVDRDMTLLDVDLSYFLNERLMLVGGIGYKDLEQDGNISGAWPVSGRSAWDMETWTAEAGLEFQVSSGLTLSGGMRHETRDVDSSWYYDGQLTEQEEETKSMGYFLTLGWHPSSDFRVMAGFENGSYDDPYAMSSPTDRQMYRIRAQYGGGEGFSISGSYRLTCNENDETDWDSDYETLNIRAGYRIASFSASVGYSLVDIKRDMDQTVVAGGQLFFPHIAYDADSDYVDARFIWSFAEYWKAGGDLRFYQNEGDFDLDRKDFRAYVEHEIGEHYMAHLGYRYTKYEEDLHDIDDYEANIVEIAIGYNW